MEQTSAIFCSTILDAQSLQQEEISFFDNFVFTKRLSEVANTDLAAPINQTQGDTGTLFL